MYLCINSSGANWFKRPRVDADTSIHFPAGGPVAVNIARKEYRQFKEQLSFDLLFQSLGDLFLDSLDLYRQGQSERILARVNEG